MVSPAPSADLGPPPPSLRGFERIERTLRLVEDGAVVVVEAPWLVTVREATRRLLALDPDLAVVTRFEDFRAARDAPGIIWWDRGLDAVWGGSAAGRRLWRLSVDDDYRVMRERLRGVPSGDGVVWEGVMRREDVWRIRWLGAESRRRGMIIERPAPALASPGWWPLGASDPDDPRVSTLYQMKLSHPSRVAALTGYRPH